MNIGTLSSDVLRFVNTYKKIGYPTKTRLIEDAIELLRRKKEAETRENALLEAGKSYKEDYVWRELDGEDYES